MNISREQYHRFLTNQCSEEERLLFASYLEQHPEILEHWLQSDDWEQFKDDVYLHPAFSARMRDRFMGYIQGRKKKRRILYRISAAAAVTGVAVSALLWTLTGTKHNTVVTDQKPASPTAGDTWQVASNEADTTVNILLNDHSTVALHAHSRLQFKKIFDRHKRDLFLQGTARFSVAKDTARPFTVYAQGIATTAVGTVFTVTANTDSKEVQVKLHKGKVRVRTADTNTISKAKEIYLLPGDALVINAAGKYGLQRLAKKKTPGVSIVKKNEPTGGNALSFHNMPLADVLERLKQHFGADIRYQPGELKAIYVTASFTEQDTLSDVLNILCTLNNLHVEHTGAVFTISR